MIPVSQVETLQAVVGKCISYRTVHCVCFVASPQLHPGLMKLIEFAEKNLLTLDHYRRSIPEDLLSWNVIEYGTLSFQTDLFEINDPSTGELKYILVSPYLIWLIGSWVIDVSLPYENKEEPPEFDHTTRWYLKGLYDTGKSEGWYACCYLFDNTNGRMDSTADNFVHVKNPKLVPATRLRQELGNVSKKPWWSYGLSETYHTLLAGGKFYVAYLVNGQLQFITELDAFMSVTGNDHFNPSTKPLPDSVLESCGMILGQNPVELLNDDVPFIPGI